MLSQIRTASTVHRMLTKHIGIEDGFSSFSYSFSRWMSMDMDMDTGQAQSLDVVLGCNGFCGSCSSVSVENYNMHNEPIVLESLVWL